MPASMHPIFPHPDDKGVAIWRYMDFIKYVSMLEHNGLYMCRSDLLGDPFEGSVSRLNVESERSFFLGGQMPGLDKEVAERFLAKHSDFRRSFRKLIYLSCWYVSSGRIRRDVGSLCAGRCGNRDPKQFHKSVQLPTGEPLRRLSQICGLQARGTPNKRQLVFSLSV